MGWSVALILVEVNPEAQDAILKRGYDYGESRVIVGAHYESDVSMARLVASAAVARLHADPEFMRDMAAARDEFRKVKAGQNSDKEATSDSHKKRPKDNNTVTQPSNKQNFSKKKKTDSAPSLKGGIN